MYAVIFPTRSLFYSIPHLRAEGGSQPSDEANSGSFDRCADAGVS